MTSLCLPPITSAGVPAGGIFLGGYHSHPDGNTFSDDGHGVGDLPSVIRASGQANRPVTLYLGRDGGFFGTKTTVEVATGVNNSGTWTTTTKTLGTYP